MLKPCLRAVPVGRQRLVAWPCRVPGGRFMTVSLGSSGTKSVSRMALFGAQRDRQAEGREAPAAKDVQPSQGDGSGKARGALRGSAEGASKGRQPLAGPCCCLQLRRPHEKQRKNRRARRAAKFFPEVQALCTHYQPRRQKISARIRPQCQGRSASVPARRSCARAVQGWHNARNRNACGFWP